MSGVTKKLKLTLKGLGPFMGLISIFIIGVILQGETFFNLYNQLNVLDRISIIALPALGMTCVIIAAGIDLSVGSIVSFSSVICAMLLMERTWTRATSFVLPILAVFVFIVIVKILSGIMGKQKRQKLFSIVIGILAASFFFYWGYNQTSTGFSTIMVLFMVPVVGLFLGAVNGIIISKGKIQPFIVTLGMMSAAVGLAKFIAGKGGQIHAIYYEASGFTAEGTQHIAPKSFDLLSSKIAVLGVDIIPVTGLFFLAIALIVHFVLRRLKFGRYIYAIGGNEETARLSGINIDRVKTYVYSISGGVSALAGVFYCSSYTQGKADAGLTWELDAIAAVVIGGTSLMGGKGSVKGTVVGVLIIGYLSNILNLMQVPSEVQDILKGLIIVGAVLLQEGTVTLWLKNMLKKNNFIGANNGKEIV